MQCKECGYVGVRSRFAGLTFEADERVRNQGAQFVANEQPCAARVFCYANQREFDPPKVGGESTVLQTLSLNIDCQSFTKWQRGKTPKEHADMALLERVEQINAIARREAAELQDRWNRQNFRWVVIAAGSAVLSSIAAVATYFRH